jgi:glutamyl-tRNA reductase
VVTLERVQPAVSGRPDRPLCILDIAIPRDVDPSVGALDNVFLYDLDDLRTVVTTSVERRRTELPTAEDLIANEVERYWEWFTGLSAVPVLTHFRGEMNRLREREVATALRQLDHLAPADRAVVEQLSRSLMNKFLHGPTVRLRAAAANGRGLGIIDAVRYLFGLDDTSPADWPSDRDHHHDLT